jgi:hypothetical protein
LQTGMDKLISKIQLRNFEVGEFVEIQNRSYEETIKLIEDFPWLEQRRNNVIDLTNPSVTIEGVNNDFLKIALFYNGKFVIYYLNEQRELYTKGIINLADSFCFVNKVFKQEIIGIDDFKKDITWFQSSLKHFISQEFRYVTTDKKAFIYLLKTSGINIFGAIAFFIMMIYNDLEIPGVIIMLFFLFMIVGVNVILFINYYYYARGKILLMSRGNDEFYFGKVDAPLKFRKDDILKCITINAGNRSPISFFATVELHFKTGEVLNIPNIFVDEFDLLVKLRQCEQVFKYGIPYILWRL